MNIERMNVFATREELEYIKHLRDLPLVAFTNPEPPGPGVPPTISLGEDPFVAAHRAALAHGLPEIPGYYGVDFANGEFVKARD